MMTYYDYMEFYNSPESVLAPDDEYADWLSENCPDPTDEELNEMYEELMEAFKWL